MKRLYAYIINDTLCVIYSYTLKISRLLNNVTILCKQKITESSQIMIMWLIIAPFKPMIQSALHTTNDRNRNTWIQMKKADQ